MIIPKSLFTCSFFISACDFFSLLFDWLRADLLMEKKHLSLMPKLKRVIFFKTFFLFPFIKTNFWGGGFYKTCKDNIENYLN